jgi:hypothetical protein
MHLGIFWYEVHLEGCVPGAEILEAQWAERVCSRESRWAVGQRIWQLHNRRGSRAGEKQAWQASVEAENTECCAVNPRRDHQGGRMETGTRTRRVVAGAVNRIAGGRGALLAVS